jgi:hypothetical protein
LRKREHALFLIKKAILNTNLIWERFVYYIFLRDISDNCFEGKYTSTDIIRILKNVRLKQTSYFQHNYEFWKALLNSNDKVSNINNKLLGFITSITSINKSILNSYNSLIVNFFFFF